MTISELTRWTEANQRLLTVELTRVSEALRRHAPDVPPEEEDAGVELPAPGLEEGETSAIDTLTSLFGLSAFERDVLLLCAGIELRGEFARLCAAANAGHGPSFGLALRCLDDAYWSAISPAAPLRYWRLLELGASESLVQAPLRIDERILSFLTGIEHLDERLQGYLQPVAAPAYLTASHAELALQIAHAWLEGSGLLQLDGRSAVCNGVAAAAAGHLGLRLYRLAASDIPAGPTERSGLIRLWEREAALSRAALLVDATDSPENDAAVAAFLGAVKTPVALSGELRSTPGKSLARFEIRPPSAEEQRDLWSRALGQAGLTPDEDVETATSHFSFSFEDAYAAARNAVVSSELSGGTSGRALWVACVGQARPHMEHLAQRIVPAATWDDLVLPELQLGMLRDVTRQVRHRRRVYDDWGFADGGSRGLGITALFAGDSGTGKTMAAEVIANDLGLDLFRVDLSSVVSKYIGETEKNLRQVFDAAEDGGAVLLFDEADALFGARSQVRDSHDRYANIEVSYLLQRMEAYRGLAILTTNMKDALDKAFLRRLRFIVNFPFPNTSQRAEIWQRIFPPRMPAEALAVEKLARLSMSGGNIRNIALSAAFLAADANEPLRMGHLLKAARGESAKLDRTLAESEVGDWL